MQRRVFDVQIPADEWDDPPSLVPIEPDLSAIRVPTYVVSGGQDMDHFQNIARHLAAEIPDAHLVELDWAGHLPALERPAETAALLTGFLTDPA
jgi:pimeloyl-ACP methyl ester carboxylesterase